LSDRPDHLATLEDRIDDIRAVMDAVESERAHILGISEGGSMAMLFAATHPRRTRSLIVHGAPPRYAWAPDWPWGATAEQHEASWQDSAARGYQSDYESDGWRRWAGELWDDTAFTEWWTRFRRSGGTPGARRALADMNMLLDVRPVLSTISVPTLITVREDDPVAPLDSVRGYASMIPGARVVVLPGTGHLLGDRADEWVALVREFITVPSQIRTDRFLATLAAADVVRSTQLIARIGDRAWRDTLDRH
jgi:pimeloyl-ACP methyl ester carboxylesterase